ncbi:hypothetical protein ABZW10_22995 [Kitasatospora sp. NPDC004723]|uniref:DUF7507 domain-containing protein n=1 Tax=Kitasatospora sp. NPDC004723 TaxID=3154288 RepID=UPI0033B6B29E
MTAMMPGSGRHRARRLRSGAVVGALALTASTLGLAVTALTPAPAQAAVPTITCTTNPNIFNTGYNAATGGVLADNSKDANWQVAGPFPATAAVSPPPGGAVFAAANVGSLAPTVWATSPYNNAQWISQQTKAAPDQGPTNGDWYYRYQFDLSPSVSPSAFALSMNFLADNAVAEVYVNGVAQSTKTTGLPQTTLTAPPPAGQMTGIYYYAGFTTANAAQTTLKNNWQTGLNTIDVQIKSGANAEGFDAQVRPSVLCPAPSVSLKKTATVTPAADQTGAKAGDTITYSFAVTNTGSTPLVSVAVNDPALGVVTCPKPPASGLAPGASITCTSTTTHTVTQADVDTGSVTNTATATGTNDVGMVSPPATSTATVPTQAPAPALSVRKSAVTGQPDKLVLGEQIAYSFVVTNTGNVTLKDVKVNETGFTGTGTPPVATCPTAEAASLAPGASTTCTATYTVTQADVDAGSIKNSATGTGNPPTGPPPVSPPSEVTVPAPSDPALTVVKSASTGKLVAGEKITYSFRVTNTGNVTLKDVKVTDGPFTGTGTLDPVSCPSGAASLAPGASVVCTAGYTVTQADVDAGSVKNSATATGTPPTGPPPVSPPSEVTITQPPAPAMTVVKSATSSRPDKLVLGEQITYSFAVKNTGNVTLKDVKVTEGAFTGSGTLSPVTCPSAEAASLAPGATVTCTATYTVTQADVDAGSIKNTATGTGTPPTGPPPVSPPSEVTVPAPSDPKLTVVKSASTGKLVAGEAITYTFEVKNTGNVTLKDVKVTEGTFTGSGTLSPVTCPATEAASLAPGATMICTATYTVTQADVDAGSIKNTATGTGTPPTGPPPVSPPSEVTITEPPAPALAVAKTSSTEKLVAGEKITYSFRVTNTGNVTLKDVKVTDGPFTGTGTLDPVVCPAEAASLAPGATVTCTAGYTVTQADVDAGSVKNSATATGTPPSGPPPVSPPGEVTITQPPAPAMTVVKSATSSRPDKLIVGETVTYSFVVKNTGNVTLKDVKVNETAFTGTGTLSPVTCPTAQAASLAPGAEMTCTATYTVTQADVDAGSIKNSATTTGTPPTGPPPVSPPGEVTVPGPSEPALTVAKTATSSQPDKLIVGEKVAYKFAVKNTGNVTLKDVKVTEGEFTGTGTPPAITCPATEAASLAPGATMTCTATYTVTQADVDRGFVRNTATATGTPPSGPPPVSPPSEVTVPAPNEPALTVTKTATSSQPDKLIVGETISYKFTVKNTGNVTLTDITVNEGDFTGTGELSPLACPTAEAASLAPGAEMTCTATYTVTQADVDAGSIRNSATATGVPPTGPPPVSPPSEVTVPAPNDPKLTVVKSASTGNLVAGEQITYSFAVKNTGNVTLKDVKVTEAGFSGSGTLSPVTCPSGAASLAPGATVTCTATYTVTQADVDAGSVTNSATATGTPPSGPPPVSPPSEVTVTTQDQPGLSVVKSASTGTLVVGEEIVYKFEVKNTGNVTLKDVKVTEGAFTGSGTLSPVTCPNGAASLAPGAIVTCTATYTVTQADVDAGSVKNSATGTGTPPRGEPPVSPPTGTTITTTDQPGLSVVKTGHSSKPDELVVGEQVRYDFTVTNTGNVTLKDVKVNETAFTGTGTLSPVTCPAAEAASLAPGATMTCTATYTVTQADVDAGSIKNAATATGTPPRGEPPVSPPSETIVPAPEKPALAVVKTSSTGTLVAGERITYKFAVTNTGNVTLKDVKITEGQFTGGGKLDPVVCPKEAASLAPGATVLCTAGYTVTQADVDAGSVKNTATATGTPPKGEPPVSPPSGTTVTTTDQPGLSVLKSATSGKEDKLVAGEKITYSFAVRNTGNVTLKDIKITEGEFTGHGKLDPLTCPKEAATLAPGTTVTCTAGYTVTQADVDAGSVKNTATATGTPPRGEPPVSPPSEVELPQAPKPALAVVKSAEAEKPGKLVAGEKITYRFAVTNTGNVTVKDVKVTEGEFTGTGKLSPVTCPKETASLAPGATVTCTAGYTVTQADVDAGTIRNTATGTGTPPRGEPPVSPPSEVTVPSDGHGALSLTKSAEVTDVNGNGRTDTGDRIDWKLTVANQGTATVTGIKVDDPTAGAVTCPRTSLAPGETMTCTTEPHTITAQDAQRGRVVNTATATGAGATSSEATATVKVEPEPVAPGTPGKPAAPGPTGILARTGTAVLAVAGIAGALLVVGGLALGLSRRRRNH